MQSNTPHTDHRRYMQRLDRKFHAIQTDHMSKQAQGLDRRSRSGPEDAARAYRHDAAGAAPTDQDLAVSAIDAVQRIYPRQAARLAEASALRSYKFNHRTPGICHYCGVETGSAGLTICKDCA